MNSFAVEWEPPAEDELARIWLKAVDPSAITSAQAQADQLLARDPIKHGRYLSEGLFCIDVKPLIVNFTIDHSTRLVTVTWERLWP